MAFIHNLVSAAANPIGIDLDGDTLRLAQVARSANGFRIIAAASIRLPRASRHDSAARLADVSRILREQLRTGDFRGARAVLSLPADMLHVRQLKLPRLADAAIAQALPWELTGQLPFDPTEAVLRHIVAGQTHQDSEPKSEVIVAAAARKFVEALLSAAARAQIEVVGIQTRSKAIVDCFSNLYRRRTDRGITSCFIDLGAAGSAAAIARDGRLLFMRSLDVDGANFGSDDVAAAESPRLAAHGSGLSKAIFELNAPAEEAPVKDSPAHEASPIIATDKPPMGNDAAAAPVERRHTPDLSAFGSGPPEAEHPSATTSQPAAATTGRPGPSESQPFPSALIEQLAMSIRHHDAIFPTQPVQRLIFVGAGAQNIERCRQIAQSLRLSAQLGDALARMRDDIDPGAAMEIDTTRPAPAWAAAIGLSMGEPVDAGLATSAERTCPPIGMTEAQALSFLPPDYASRRRRLCLRALTTGLASAGAMALLCIVVFVRQSLYLVEHQNALINQAVERAASRIEQMRVAQNQQRLLLSRSEMSAALIQRTPRSALLAAVANAMPSGACLTSMEIAPAPASASAAQAVSAFEAKKAALLALHPPVAMLPSEVTIVGTVDADEKVSQLLEALTQARFITDVRLLASELAPKRAASASSPPPPERGHSSFIASRTSATEPVDRGTTPELAGEIRGMSPLFSGESAAAQPRKFIIRFRTADDATAAAPAQMQTADVRSAQ